MMIDKKPLLNYLAHSLEISESALTDETSLYAFDLWDSLVMISALGIIDQYYKVLMKINDLMQCKTLMDIFNLIESMSQHTKNKL